jgi:lysyl-tRNA synthetase class 2
LTDTNRAWWDRDAHADRRPLLLARNAIAAAVRRYFAGKEFVEVDPAILAVSPGNEAHIHGLRTQVRDPSGGVSIRYLHSSPEFAMKKLLAAGENRIFSIGHVFRDRERSALHATEFTMVEWYRAGEPYEATMADCATLLQVAARAANTDRLVHRQRSVDPLLPWRRTTVAEAFAAHAGIDLLSTIDADGRPDTRSLAAAAIAGGISVGNDDTWSDIFSRVLVAKVEPQLGKDSIEVLDSYPAPEAALARISTADRRVAERFEVYACGMEVANGFGELIDAAEQRRRFEAEMTEKERIYGERYPVDEDFIAALASMPPASGCALGFDRMVMLATAADRIERVQWTASP